MKASAAATALELPPAIVDSLFETSLLSPPTMAESKSDPTTTLFPPPPTKPLVLEPETALLEPPAMAEYASHAWLLWPAPTNEEAPPATFERPPPTKAEVPVPEQVGTASVRRA